MRPSSRSTKKTIDPDNVGPAPPFEVSCVYDQANRTVAVTSYCYWRSVPRYEQPFGYSYKVAYKRVTMTQLLALVNQSAFCWQDIWYEIHARYLHLGEPQ